jgi:hypothetical protein
VVKFGKEQEAIIEFYIPQDFKSSLALFTVNVGDSSDLSITTQSTFTQNFFAPVLQPDTTEYHLEIQPEFLTAKESPEREMLTLNCENRLYL